MYFLLAIKATYIELNRPIKHIKAVYFWVLMGFTQTETPTEAASAQTPTWEGGGVTGPRSSAGFLSEDFFGKDDETLETRFFQSDESPSKGQTFQTFLAFWVMFNSVGTFVLDNDMALGQKTSKVRYLFRDSNPPMVRSLFLEVFMFTKVLSF